MLGFMAMGERAQGSGDAILFLDDGRLGNL